MAIIRPVAAITSAIVAGVLVGRETTSEITESSSQASCCASKNKPDPEKTSCCSAKRPSPTEPKQPSCCASKQIATPTQWQKIQQAITFSCNKLLSDTMTWLVIGLFFAALVQTYVPESFLSSGEAAY
eukprot:TRINITY_DN2360_c0_g1_i2.p1 TRINITY_DN2360_c0_g1~~TRINITY_DN2360_c0_g1_i2.p1  ORF type:complete len:138 (-),score=13.19 TRINITY_DN2360_c0_g1_i2:690-1073(-)